MSERGFREEYVVTKSEKKNTSADILHSWIDTRENYAQLVVRCQQILYRLNISENQLSAQDLAHEAVEQALEHVDQFIYSDDDKLRGWLQTIALNRARNVLSTSRRHRLAAEGNPEEESLGVKSRFIPTDELEISEKINREKWLKAIDTLSPERREILELHLRNYSNVEIATELQIPPRTVASRLSRAFNDIAKYLEVDRPRQNKGPRTVKNTLV
jgi:RNA polymerase sigma factor (sigma-70 family)